MAFSGWRCCQRLVRLGPGPGLGLGSVNKKGPEEAHAHRLNLDGVQPSPAMRLGTTTISSLVIILRICRVRLPKGCANHSDRKLKVKRNGQQGLRFDYFSGLPAVRRESIFRNCSRSASWPALTPVIPAGRERSTRMRDGRV